MERCTQDHPLYGLPGSVAVGGGTGNHGSVVYSITAGHWLVLSAPNTDSNVATLSSGTVTINTGHACAPGQGCIYKLTNCGVNGSAGTGTLEIGAIDAGVSFIVNSLGPTASVLTSDSSKVCWQIN